MVDARTGDEICQQAAAAVAAAIKEAGTMKKKKIVAIIKSYIADLKAGGKPLVLLMVITL